MKSNDDNTMFILGTSPAGQVIQSYKLRVSITGRCAVLADQALKSVMANIARNAVQHGKTDRLDIELCDTSPSHCDIRITDFGIGLDQSVVKGLAIDENLMSKDMDSGLGLHISPRLIERYKGRLICETALGEGATFIIVLPKANEFDETAQE